MPNAVQRFLSKFGGEAVFPSMQASVSPANTQKTGPVLEANVSSERPTPQTRDFLDPHVTGSWSRRTLGQERGMLSTPAVPGPGSSVNSQVIEDKITQASWNGKYAARRAFGINKSAGFSR
jgi:hypothetical protein